MTKCSRPLVQRWARRRKANRKIEHSILNYTEKVLSSLSSPVVECKTFVSYEGNCKRYLFSSFPLKFLTESITFSFCLFFPLKGCYIHCVQMQTEGDPEALCSHSVKENSKFISLYSSVSKGCSTCEARGPRPRTEGQGAELCGSLAWIVFVEGQQVGCLLDGNYGSWEAARSQVGYGCGGEKQGMEKICFVYLSRFQRYIFNFQSLNVLEKLAI